MAAHIVSFDEIHTPRRVQFGQGIVVSLRAWLGCVHTPHVGIPDAVIIFVSYVSGVILSSLDWRVLLDRLSRNTAHDVDAELQTFAVHVVSERLKATSIRG